MQVDDEKLLAWLDGELSGEDAAEVAAAVAGDPKLAALAAEHRATAARLQAGFASLLTARIPPQIADLAPAAATGASATITDLATVRAARHAPARRGLLPRWAAIAATLVIGVVAGRTSSNLGPQPIMVQGGADLVAHGALATALEEQLASTPAPAESDVRVMVTFRGQDGRICRTWSSRSQEGIACREDVDWRIAAAFSSAGTREGDYRMAGGNNPQLLATLDALIAGEPFDRAQEQAARNKGWQ